jgi:glycosyltransferase involved in cell wall biosynthesis
MKGISVVIPVYNEELNVKECYNEVRQVLVRTGEPFEIIFIDDGSKDKTVQNLLSIGSENMRDEELIVIQFRRNFGQTAALAAGFEAAQYEYIFALDGDLQNDPSEIPAMLEKLREGYDLVAGWRKERKDKMLSRKLPSMIANRVISLSTNVQLHDYGCTLKGMRSEIAKGIKLYGEMHRFIPALAAEMGAKIVEVPVNHRERKHGTSKYGISRTIRVILDLLTVKFLLGYSKRPIHLFGTVGLGTSFVGGLLLAVLIYQRLFLSVPLGNRPILSLAIMLVIIGFQFLVFGLLAELLARTYYESQNKPTYIVRSIYKGGAPVEDALQVRNKSQSLKRVL